MKQIKYFLILLSFSILFIFSCNNDDNSIQDPNNPPNGEFEMVDVTVNLPPGATVDLSSTSIVSLGATAMLTNNIASDIPFNPDTAEIGYLMDNENNVLLAGFISDTRKEISVETTAEVMLYYALDYYLLPDSGKKAFLNNVTAVQGFTDFVNSVTELFVQDPLMYMNGTYIAALQSQLNSISSKKATSISNRIFFDDDATKSGVTLSSIDSTNIRLQNSFPRRSNAIIYKQSITDRNGNETEIPNYTDNVFQNFELEIGRQGTISELEVGSSLAQVNAQQVSIADASDSGPILLPVNPSTEFVAAYEVVIIGSGLPQVNGRDMTSEELTIYENLTKKTYVLDYFLPTLLDIGGNKALLPPFGSDTEEALFNAVSPILDQYPEVVELVVQNEFKEATGSFLPALYEDIRISDDLRNVLTDVYNIISMNGNAPNTFIQSQELIETGIERTNIIMRVIDQNIKANNRSADLRTTAFNFESWIVKSIDAIVEFQQAEIDLCLGESAELRVTASTVFDPEVEDFEFHWSTSNNFGGRVQDIGGDSSNFGTSIVTTNNFVSYISAALASDLNDGDNLETVTVTLFFKNKQTGVLTEAGTDTMIVNNLKGVDSLMQL